MPLHVCELVKTFYSSWFDELNCYFNVSGNASYFYKPKGKGRTFGVTQETARENLKKQLKSKDTAFIYHCYNHYCCPIGFECEPTASSNILNAISLDSILSLLLLVKLMCFLKAVKVALRTGFWSLIQVENIRVFIV